MGRIVAIDYGGKRVGVATTDPLQLIATGLQTVHSKDIISFLEAYLAKEEVETIVVGLPRSLSNEKTNATEMVENFVKHLGKKFPKVSVVTADERFTSKMASQAMVMGGMKKEKRKNKATVDETSAVIILQGYLQSKNK